MKDAAFPNSGATLQPLSERILSRLPGRFELWVVAWALIPWLNAGVNLLMGTERTSPVWEQSTTLVVLNYAALSFASGFSLWATRSLVRRLAAIRASPSASGGSLREFRGMNSVTGPLIASACTAAVFGFSALAQDGWIAGIVRGGTWLLLGVAIWTYLWTYASLLLGLNRLGREHLVPEAIHVDPGLGLQPLGRIASTGLWMLLIWLVPVLLTGLSDLAGVLVGMLVLTAALATFFLSLVGLHRQMVAVRSAELATARDLYGKAYEPVHDSPTLETLEQQRNLLSAADTLEKRATAMHEWPIDEGTLARVITITTSVIAMAIGRVILDPFGL